MRKNRINSRAKGANGERQAAKWLYYNLKLNAKPERNLEQVRSGGGDLIDIGCFCIEVKRCEKLQIIKWWNQALKSAEDRNEEPVLMYRRNKESWKFIVDHSMEIFTERDFRIYAKSRLIEIGYYENN